MHLPEPPAKRMSSAAAKRAGEWEALLAEIRACRTLDELSAWHENAARFELLPVVWSDGIEDAVSAHADRLIDQLHTQKQD